jgi:hypothetical protein
MDESILAELEKNRINKEKIRQWKQPFKQEIEQQDSRVLLKNYLQQIQ